MLVFNRKTVRHQRDDKQFCLIHLHVISLVAAGDGGHRTRAGFGGGDGRVGGGRRKAEELGARIVDAVPHRAVSRWRRP